MRPSTGWQVTPIAIALATTLTIALAISLAACSKQSETPADRSPAESEAALQAGGVALPAEATLPTEGALPADATLPTGATPPAQSATLPTDGGAAAPAQAAANFDVSPVPVLESRSRSSRSAFGVVRQRRLLAQIGRARTGSSPGDNFHSPSRHGDPARIDFRTFVQNNADK